MGPISSQRLPAGSLAKTWRSPSKAVVKHDWPVASMRAIVASSASSTRIAVCARARRRVVGVGREVHLGAVVGLEPVHLGHRRDSGPGSTGRYPSSASQAASASVPGAPSTVSGTERFTWCIVGMGERVRPDLVVHPDVGFRHGCRVRVRSYEPARHR